MKKIKRLFLLLLTISLAIPSVNIYAEEENVPSGDFINIEERIKSAEAAGHKYAYMQIDGQNAKTKNTSPDIRSFSFTQVNGKSALLRDKNNTNCNIFLRIDDSYWFDQEGSRMAITIEYLDSEDASFSILYNAKGWETTRPAEMVATEGTGKWKTKTYYLEDIIASTGTDIRIRSAGWGSSSYGMQPVTLGNIFVEMDKTEHLVEAKASNGYRGFIYDYGKSDSMKIELFNSKSDEAKVNINYSIYNNEGKVMNTGEVDEFIISGSAEKEINPGVTDCGTYTVELNVKAEYSGGIVEEYQKTQGFSIMRTYEEGDTRNSMAALCAHFDYNQYGGIASAPLLERIGISSWRGDANWNNLEVSHGTYTGNIPQDNAREYLLDKGVSSMLIAGNISNLYNGGRGDRWYVDTDAALKGYYNFVKHIASLGGVEYIEVINEFNHPGINEAKMSVEGYVKYCKAAYEAVQEVNPDIKVAAGGLAGYDQAFLENFMKAGGLKYCDIISYHPYQQGGFSIQSFLNETNKTNELALKYHGETKPIILTEMGWSTESDAVLNYVGTPEPDRKTCLPIMLAHAQHEGSIEKIYYFCSIKMGTGKNQRESSFGLWEYPYLENDCIATDSLVTLAAECKFLAGAKPANAIEKDNYATVAYEFTREGKKNIATLYTSNKEETLSIDLGCDTVQVYDVFGNPRETIKGNNGKFTFNLSDDMIYVEGDFKRFDEVEEHTITQDKTAHSVIFNDSLKFTITDTQKRNLKVKLDFDKEVFAADEIYSMTNGNADIKVKAINGKIGLYHIGVTVFDDNGVYYRANMPITIVSEMLDVKMQTIQASETDSTRWTVRLDIKNISNENSVSGVCKIVEPQKFASRAKKFTDLAPGETIQLQLNLPELIVKRPELLKVEIDLSNGYRAIAEENIDFTTALYAAKKPTLDGIEKPGEWKTSLLGEDRREKTYMTTSGISWGGIDDLSMKIKMMYDEDYLYMLCRVRDNVFSQEEREFNLWKADCIQIGVVEDTKAIVETAALTFTDMCIGKSNDEVIFYRHSSMVGKPTETVKSCEGAIVHSNGETIYELKIPWTELLRDGHKAKKGDAYGFSMLANDSDGSGRRGFIFYNDGIGVTKDASKFGRLQLK